MFSNVKSLKKIKAEKVPHLVFITVASLVAVFFVLIFFIDILNVFGLGDKIAENNEVGYFWYYWSVHPLPGVELQQWPLLAAAVIIFIFSAGIAWAKKNREEFGFFALMGAGLSLMLVEDVGDTRHTIREFIGILTGGGDYGYGDTIFELIYFAVMGGILLYALLRFKRVYWHNKHARNYLFTGFALYGIAASSSWVGQAFRHITENIRDVYTHVGEVVMRFVFVRDERSLGIYERSAEAVLERRGYPIEFAFMDTLYEESLELLGVAALLAAGCALFLALRSVVAVSDDFSFEPESPRSSGSALLRSRRKILRFLPVPRPSRQAGAQEPSFSASESFSDKNVGNHDKKSGAAIAYGSLAFMAAGLLVIYLIDAFNILGLRYAVFDVLNVPYAWYAFFVFPFPIFEITAWYMLVAAIFAFVFASGVLYAARRKDFMPLLLIATALSIFFIEEKGEVSTTASYAHFIFSWSGISGALLSWMLEFIYIAIIVSLLAVAFYKIRKSSFWEGLRYSVFLYAGTALMAASILFSWIGRLFRKFPEFAGDVYTNAGEFVVGRLILDSGTVEFAAAIMDEQGVFLGSLFTDNVFKTSVEFAGAGFLLAAGIAAVFLAMKKEA